MRISYGLISKLATLGDVEALNVMTEWEKLGDPLDPSSNAARVEAYFQDNYGFILHTPSSILPKRTPTLMGIPAPAVSLAGADVVIEDDDGEID
jgi:hypothetical protein